jgi:hypothetical protein
MRIAHSVSFFRHTASHYEHPNCGESQGKFFANYIPTLLAAHEIAFPGWDLVVHHDDAVRELPAFATLERYLSRGWLKLVPMGKAETLCGSMLWRMSAMKSHDYVVCRDIDSLPCERDFAMVSDFIRSGLDVHAILDSESHSGPLMGGMTAYRSAAVWPIWQTLGVDQRLDMNQHGADQIRLNRELWPHFKSRTMIHQTRIDVMCPEAQTSAPTRLAQTPLDKVVRHIGGAYDVEKAWAAIAMYWRGA